MLLVVVAAPLLVLSDLPLALLWALPTSLARAFGGGIHHSGPPTRFWQKLTHLIVAWLLSTSTLWIWHVSSFYQAALQDETIHILEHLAFLVSAMLFWWVLLRPTEQKHRHYGVLVLYLFTTVLQNWGFTALQDQQLAGLIMGIPRGTVFTLLTIGYFAAWLRAPEQCSTRLQRRLDT